MIATGASGSAFKITKKITIMSFAPYTNLQATPDFAAFQFSNPTVPDPTIRQVQFNGQQGGRLYHVEFRNRPADSKDDGSWLESRDFHCVVLTTLQILEIYSDRYPRRILRFTANTLPKAQVFGAILTRYSHLLSSLFLVEKEITSQNRPVPDCLIRRKPVPFFSIHTIESKWSGSSRIFKSDFSIELDKSIRIGLTLPTV